MSRRAWLRLTSALGSTVALRGLVGCGDDLDDPVYPQHATAAVHDPSIDGFVVAIWSERASAARVTLVPDDGAARAVELDDAGLGHVVIAGLAAGAPYRVAIELDDGTTLGPYHARTLPAPDDASPVRLTVGADVDPSPEFASAIFDTLAAQHADLHVTIGDFPYADNPPGAITLDEYRARHVEVRRLPAVQRWLRSAALAAIYDDHEYRNNWRPSQYTAEPERYAAALQSWDEFFPLRAASDVRYRSWRVGANVECFLLDTRRYRDQADAPATPSKTMLGATQKAWLLDGLARSTATFKLIFTSVPLGFGVGDDTWTSFLDERDDLIARIAALELTGVLVLSGDQHWFAAHRHARGLREIQVGPLARGFGTPPPAAAGVLFRAVTTYNAAVLEVSPTTLVVRGVDDGGATLWREALTPTDLAPR